MVVYDFFFNTIFILLFANNIPTFWFLFFDVTQNMYFSFRDTFFIFARVFFALQAKVDSSWTQSSRVSFQKVCYISCFSSRHKIVVLKSPTLLCERVQDLGKESWKEKRTANKHKFFFTIFHFVKILQW